jgi:RES domain
VAPPPGFQPLSDPPADLDRQAVPLAEPAPQGALYRIHRLTDPPLAFGRDARNRFDDPRKEFGVCYFGLSREAAFAETILRRPRVRLISRAFVDERVMSEFLSARDLRLVAIYGAGLARIGATADIASGDHEHARRWSRAIWSHPSHPDGVTYRCRHDDDQFAVALFDRARDALTESVTRPLRQDTSWFGDVLNRYEIGLED